jgi:hypothetical protein
MSKSQRRKKVTCAEQHTRYERHIVRRLRTVRQFAEEHDGFREPSLRWLIFKAKENGLERAGAIVRVGRKVLIDEDRFFAWIDAQQPYTPIDVAEISTSATMSAKGGED